MVNFPLLCWFFTECKVFWVPRSKHDVVFSLVSLTHEIAPQSQAGAKAGHLQGYLQGSMGSQFDPGYLLYIYIYGITTQFYSGIMSILNHFGP